MFLFEMSYYHEGFISAWWIAIPLQMAEYRVSIYGRKQSEWDQLASWVVNNDLYSENVVWLIQVSSNFPSAPVVF